MAVAVDSCPAVPGTATRRRAAASHMARPLACA